MWLLLILIAIPILLLSIPLILLAPRVYWAQFKGRGNTNPTERDYMSEFGEYARHRRVDEHGRNLMAEYRRLRWRSWLTNIWPALVSALNVLIFMCVVLGMFFSKPNPAKAAILIAVAYLAELVPLFYLRRFLKRFRSMLLTLDEILDQAQVQRPAPPALMEFAFYTRTGCHLCEKLAVRLESTLQDVAKAGKIRFVKRDIDDGADWYESYKHRVPVLTCEGKVLLEGRPDESRVHALSRALDQLLPE